MQNFHFQLLKRYLKRIKQNCKPLVPCKYSEYHSSFSRDPKDGNGMWDIGSDFDPINPNDYNDYSDWNTGTIISIRFVEGN